MEEAQVIQLRRGRHGLSREEVRFSQRIRMLTAMGAAVGEKGYAGTAVADVLRGAGVSRETFYEQFDNKQDCFLAAFDAGVDALVGHDARRAGRRGRPAARAPRPRRRRLPRRARHGPAFARTFLIESYAAGPEAIARRMELQQRFVDTFVEVLGVRGEDDRFACEALVAAIGAIVTERVAAGRVDELPALRAPIMGLVRRLLSCDSRAGVTVLVAALACAVAPAAASAAAGIRVTGTQQLTPRLLDVTMASDALAAPVHTRVLLPDGYAEHPDRRYPVLYLLHGGFGNVADWTEQGDAEKLTAGLPLIVVMPERRERRLVHRLAGTAGAAGRRVGDLRRRPAHPVGRRDLPDGRVAGGARGGRPLDGRLRDHEPGRAPPGRLRRRRAATRARSTSPTPPSSRSSRARRWPTAAAPTTCSATGSPTRSCGGRTTRGTSRSTCAGWRCRCRTGNGSAGVVDSGGLPADPIEEQVHEMNVSFHDRLDALAARTLWDDYGPGTHSWPYWQRDLRETLPLMLKAFADPPAAPSPFTFTAAEKTYAVWGWSVSVDREGMAFTTLADAGPSGFRLTGDGSAPATVTTGRLYCPRSAVSVRVDGGGPSREKVDGAGRLTVRVAVGSRVTVDASRRAPRRCGRGARPVRARRE